MVGAPVAIKELDIEVTPATADEIVRMMILHKGRNDALWINNYNLHAVYLHHTDETFRKACGAAAISIIDGWPVLLAARLRSKSGRLTGEHRVGSTDWLFALLDCGIPLAITALGSSFESSAAAAETVRNRFRHIRWYSFDGYTHSSTNSRYGELSLSDAIRKSDLILVGMGMPVQEQWISEKLATGELDGRVVANVGGCLDYLSGTQQLAPRWLGPLGLEWAYRLIKAPRRLFYRYCVEPVHLVRILLRKSSGCGRLRESTVGSRSPGSRA